LDDGYITSSPLLSGLHIVPAEIYAPACIVDGLPLEMVAGSTYTASIQARDYYSNNLKSLLAASVQVWKAQIEFENPDDNYLIFVREGTITDKTAVPPDATDFTGVFEVSFSPELAGTTFRILLRLNGLDVDSTAEYRTRPLVVYPAPTPSALPSNYTILPEPHQAVTLWVGVVSSTSYTYTTGEYFRVLIDGRDQFDNLRYQDTTDVFQVELTGQTTATSVAG